MNSQNVIHIRTDGAMDRDTKQTGGTGYVINFPESYEIPDIQESFRRDNQGIHRLEMIAILEGMEALIKWIKYTDGVSLGFSRVIIHTDRYSLIDKELLNPWRISRWRKNSWRNHEGKPIKDKDLLDVIDKTRKKLSNKIRGRVEIVHVRRKYNKQADKLSKLGKKGEERSRKIINEKHSKVSKRLYDGEEINYKLLKAGDQLTVRIYKKDIVQKDFEVSGEISEGEHFSKKIKIYVSILQELELHRHHFYNVAIKDVYKYHVRIRGDFEEVNT